MNVQGLYMAMGLRVPPKVPRYIVPLLPYVPAVSLSFPTTFAECGKFSDGYALEVETSEYSGRIDSLAKVP